MAFIAGVLINFQLICNSSLAKKIGIINSAFINFLVAFIFLSLYALTRHGIYTPINFSSIPPIFYAGGILAIVITLLSNFLIPKLPLVQCTVLTFLGQLFTGVIIDSVFGYDFSMKKLIGISLIFTGIMYIIVYDHLEKKGNKCRV
jgi:transporter family-2 protein